MVLPEPFTTTTPVLVSFDSTDFADGTGIVNFNGATTKQDTTTTYILTRESIFTNDPFTTSAAVTTSDAKRLDLDFDLGAFNIPKDLLGTAIITATIKGVKTTTAMQYYYIAKIKKNDVVIAQAQSETNASDSSTDYDTMTVKIPITTLAHFAQGDVLRVTMEVWAGTTSGSGTVTLFHDPKDVGEATALTTQIKFAIPFRNNV